MSVTSEAVDMPEPTLTSTSSRKKRIENFWEPVYDPTILNQPFKLGVWDFSHEKAPHRCTFNADQELARKTISSITFSECDFSGTFPEFIKFKNCTFECCDFEGSIWSKTKFSDCKFTKSSITQSSFKACEFRGCTWKDIGMSGNTTKLDRTVVTNPSAFLSAAYTRTGGATNTPTNDEHHQKYKLETSKATIARIILSTLSQIGDEKSYYEAVKINCLQSIASRWHEHRYQLKASKNCITKLGHIIRLLEATCERLIMNIAGSLNAWGASIARPTFAGIILFIIFTFIYYYTNCQKDIKTAAMTSFDITLLVGYTKHANAAIEFATQMHFAANMLLGIIWYAIMVPTIVNRISRVR